MDHSIVNSGFQGLPGLIAAWKAPSGHDEARRAAGGFFFFVAPALACNPAFVVTAERC